MSATVYIFYYHISINVDIENEPKIGKIATGKKVTKCRQSGS